jgi:uncharacterized protein YegP (UPF0339 family)
MKRGKFELRQSSDFQWYVVLVAGNGEVVMTSELYTTKSSAQAATKYIRWIAAMARGAK